ncbi:hypothetical protein CSPAE12_06386 [Colletotrichum incanum]|nr:hypothetical protein CSPAE12_06386 [Colletotrichum incanum]
MATPFQTEVWTDYGFGVFIILLRIFACWKIVGFNWQGDDHFAILILVLWTVGHNGTNTGITD